jgi:hypothetical protein
LRDRLFAFVTQIREMVFQAGLNTTAPGVNTRATLFDVRCTSFPKGDRLYQRKLAAYPRLSLTVGAGAFLRLICAPRPAWPPEQKVDARNSGL